MTSAAESVIDLFDEVLRIRGRMQSLEGVFTDPGDPTGLSMTVLSAVVRAVHPPTVPQIGRSLGYPRQTIQRHADELAERGLIRFVENPDHKRAQRLAPTEAGVTVQQRADSRSLRWAADITEGMGDGRLAEAVETLRAFRERLEAAVSRRGEAATTRSS